MRVDKVSYFYYTIIDFILYQLSTSFMLIYLASNPPTTTTSQIKYRHSNCGLRSIYELKYLKPIYLIKM